MAGTPSPYAALLGAMASKPMSGPGAMPTGPASVPGPPPPLGIGAMNVGGGANDPRSIASATIDTLTKMKAHFPQAADRIDGMIAEVRSLAAPKTPAAATPGPLPAAGPAMDDSPSTPPLAPPPMPM